MSMETVNGLLKVLHQILGSATLALKMNLRSVSGGLQEVEFLKSQHLDLL